MTPIVSVIVPAFNAAAFIGEALASARAQTLADIEILVVDDCSTDATVTLVTAAAAADPRIRLLRQDRNQGPAAARNRAIDAARGRWLALLDADDSYAPERLATLVTTAEARDADLYSDNLLLVPEDESAPRPMIPPAILSGDRRLEIIEFIARNVEDPAHPGLNLGFLKPIMRREFIAAAGLRYDERVRFAEDFGLYVDCLLAGGRWWMSPAASYRYRVRSNSLTQVQTVHDLGVLRDRLAALQVRASSTGDRMLAGHVQRQRHVVDRCYFYRWFTDELKARQLLSAARVALGSPRSLRLIVEESSRQAPVIARKLLRGGYRRRHPTKPRLRNLQ